MNEIDIFKALANETRLNILKWLKDPGKYFPPQGIHIPEGESFENSVCVGSICDRQEYLSRRYPIIWISCKEQNCSNPNAAANGLTTAATRRRFRSWQNSSAPNYDGVSPKQDGRATCHFLRSYISRISEL